MANENVYWAILALALALIIFGVVIGVMMWCQRRRRLAAEAAENSGLFSPDHQSFTNAKEDVRSYNYS